MADKTYMDGSTNKELDEAILGEDQYSTYYFSDDDTVYDVSTLAEVVLTEAPKIEFIPGSIDDKYTFTLGIEDIENFPYDCKILVWKFPKGTDPATQDTSLGKNIATLTKDNTTFKHEEAVGRYYGTAEGLRKNQEVVDYVIKTETLTMERETQENGEIVEVWSSEKGLLREVKGNFRHAPYFTLEGVHGSSGKMTSSTEVDRTLNFQLVTGDWGEFSDKLKPEYGKDKWAFENNTGEEIHIKVYGFKDHAWIGTDWRWKHIEDWKLLAAVDAGNNDDKGQDVGFWGRTWIAFEFDHDKMASTDIRQIPPKTSRIPFMFKRNCERGTWGDYRVKISKGFK